MEKSIVMEYHILFNIAFAIKCLAVMDSKTKLDIQNYSFMRGNQSINSNMIEFN